MVNALDANGNNYAPLYNTIATGGDITYNNRKTILKNLKDGMDDTFETEGESTGSQVIRLEQHFITVCFFNLWRCI
jgi:hypothetical protein